ncbi:MAG: ParA family protein [Aminipila sp.]
MCKVFAVINQKGGVGKTTTTFNMGAEIANKGNKVLLMDMDPQGSLTTSMGFIAYDIENTIGKVFEYIIRSERASNIRRGETGVNINDYILTRDNLDLIPSNLTLSVADISIVTATAREYILKKIIMQLKDSYDYIIIDCPPTLGMLVVNVLTAADSIIVPIKASEMDAKGFETLLDTVELIRMQTNPNLQIDGVLMTMFDNRLKEAREVLESLYNFCSQYGIRIYNSKIGTSTKASRAFRERKTLAEFDKGSSLATGYSDFVLEVLENGK